MSNRGDYSTNSNHSKERYSRENFRDRQNVPHWTDRQRPEGLYKKYPNYEPFNPPPQENFVYPAHMHPPPAAKNVSSKENHHRRSRSYSRDSRRSRSRSGSSWHRDDRRHHHRRSYSRSRSSSRSRRDRDSSRRKRSSRSRSRSYSRSRSHSYDRDQRRSTSRESYQKSQSHAAPLSKHRKGSESRDEISDDNTIDDISFKKYWEKTDSGEESEVDLDTELHSLAHHVDDRKRLLKESVRSLKGNRLKAMMPPYIKDMRVETLEKQCMVILEELDTDTVLNILEGKFVGAFDNEEKNLSKTGEAVKDETKKKKRKKKKPVEQTEAASSAPEESKKPKKEKAEGKSKAKKKNKSKEVKDDNEPKVKKKKLKKKESKEKTKAKGKSKGKKKKKGKKSGENKSEPGPAAHTGEKSLMELLELEYRAKAIKALLRSQGVAGMDGGDTSKAPDEPSLTSSANTSDDLKPSEDPASKGNLSVSVTGNKAKSFLPSTQSPASKELEIGQKSEEQKEENVTERVPDTSHQNLDVLDIVSDESDISDEESKKSNETDEKSEVEEEFVIEEEEEEDDEHEDTNNSRGNEKDVIELVHEALNATFEENSVQLESNGNAVLEPPGILLQGCSSSDIDGDKLRSKLLRNYRQRAAQPKGIVSKVKEAEDVLELYARDSDSASDLELTDEEDSLKKGEREENSNSGSQTEAEFQEEPKVVLQKDKESPQKLFTSVESPQKLLTSVESREVDFEDQMHPEVSQDKIIQELDSEELLYDGEESQDLIQDDPNQQSEKELVQETREESQQQTEEEVVEEVEEGEITSDVASNHSEQFDISENNRIDEIKVKVFQKTKKSGRHKSSNLSSRRARSESPLERRHKKKSSSRQSSNECSSRESDDETYSSKRPRNWRRGTDYSRSPTPSRSSLNEPERTSESVEERRTKSPIEFITNFETEPITDSNSGDESVTKRELGTDSSSLPSSNTPLIGPMSLNNFLQSKELDTNDKDNGQEEFVGVHESQSIVPSSESTLMSSKTNTNSNIEDDPNSDDRPVTWFERWFQSKSMQKVVKSNEIQKKLRSKLKISKTRSRNQKIADLKAKKVDKKENDKVVGSIQEYANLFGKNTVPGESENTNGEKKAHSDVDQPNEEDDLWGDIIDEDD